MNQIEIARDGALSLMRIRANHLMMGHYLFNEYADNITASLIDSPLEVIDDCITLIPAHVLGKYSTYLRQRLEPVDFMPDPRCFNGPETEQEAEQEKRERRPKYVRLFELVKSRAESLTGEHATER